MSVIRLREVSKRFDNKQILRDVHFRLAPKDRVGLIGNNGTGKTTILRMILGQEEPTEGTIEVDEGLRIGYFSQFSELNGNLTIQETLGGLFEPIRETESKLRTVEAALAENPEGKALERYLAEYDSLNAFMEQNGGWTYENRIDTVLSKLGFSERHRTCPIDQLSGGWRDRAALAKILLEEPDVLLLDEPTNFLDVAGLAWLEGWIDEFRGAVILVSHDRDFLDKVVNRVLEIENYRFHEYTGGFVSYIQKKRLRSKEIEREFQHEEELLAFEAEAIQDREEAARAPGKALKRRLAYIKKQMAPREVDQVVTNIYDRIRPVEQICEVSQIWKGYDDQILFHDLGFELQKSDRIAIVGPNGCGKTTLMRILAEEMPPDSGKLTWSVGNA